MEVVVLNRQIQTQNIEKALLILIFFVGNVLSSSARNTKAMDRG